MQDDVRRKDRKDVSLLVKDLNSDDAAVRFYSIESLRRLTGNDFGFKYFDDEDERKPALERWKQWLKDDAPRASSR